MAARRRIVIGDDNPAMLEAITHMLQSEFDVIAALEEARAVVDQVPKLKPDVVVLDISMEEINGFEIARQLRSGFCRSKIIFLSVHEQLEFIRTAFDAGASGYVYKSRMNVDLKTAIKAVLNDKVFIPGAPISQYASNSKTS
ncbi:MAG: response regulator transcription factor [Acidobacteriota bacterium]